MKILNLLIDNLAGQADSSNAKSSKMVNDLGYSSDEEGDESDDFMVDDDDLHRLHNKSVDLDDLRMRILESTYTQISRTRTASISSG